MIDHYVDWMVEGCACMLYRLALLNFSCQFFAPLPPVLVGTDTFEPAGSPVLSSKTMLPLLGSEYFPCVWPSQTSLLSDGWGIIPSRLPMWPALSSSPVVDFAILARIVMLACLLRMHIVTGEARLQPKG